jgi:hypothetical protein
VSGLALQEVRIEAAAVGVGVEDRHTRNAMSRKQFVAPSAFLERHKAFCASSLPIRCPTCGPHPLSRSFKWPVPAP